MNNDLFERYSNMLSSVLAEIPGTAVAILGNIIARSNRVFIVGNGGSAATASHMQCDFAKGTGKPINAISLTDNVPHITALANDVGYEHIFSSQLESHRADEHDLILILSVSGTSPNVVKAAEYGDEHGIPVFSIVGWNADMKDRRLMEVSVGAIQVNSMDFGVVEDVHSIIMHAITRGIKDMP